MKRWLKYIRDIIWTVRYGHMGEGLRRSANRILFALLIANQAFYSCGAWVVAQRFDTLPLFLFNCVTLIFGVYVLPLALVTQLRK